MNVLEMAAITNELRETLSVGALVTLFSLSGYSNNKYTDELISHNILTSSHTLTEYGEKVKQAFAEYFSMKYS